MIMHVFVTVSIHQLNVVPITYHVAPLIPLTYQEDDEFVVPIVMSIGNVFVEGQ